MNQADGTGHAARSRTAALLRSPVSRWLILAVPVYLAVRAASSPAVETRAVWTVGALALVPALWISHRWDLTGVRLRPWWAAVVAVVLALGWLRGGQVGPVRFDLIAIVVTVVVLVPSLPTLWAARGPTSDGVAVALPLGQPFAGYVVQGGASRRLNHHHPNPQARWAIDLVPVSGPLIRNAVTGAVPVEVVAPVAGTVVAAVDRYPNRRTDRSAVRPGPSSSPSRSPSRSPSTSPNTSLDPGEPDPEPAYGNQVVIENVSAGVVTQIHLCHLAERSIRVTEGQTVAQGDPIGLVGDSGQCSEPHLHVHAVQVGEQGTAGVPLVFADRSPWRGRLFLRTATNPVKSA